MNLDLEIEFSKASIFAELDALKKQIDDQRPLPPNLEGLVMQKLRLDWNYNSNAIEGNKLTYGETVAFLMEGITAKGKPLKDHLDIRGHNDAIHFLTDLVKDPRGITETDIRALHKMILVERYKVDAQTADGKPTTKWVEIGEYKSMSNHVETSTGEIHYYASPEDVRIKMPKLIEWYNEASSKKAIHPVVTAALFHHKFVAIHPFDDGNGRLSRVLMNLILMQNGFPPAIVKMDDRKNYYSLLSRADNSDNWPFVEYIAERVQSSLNIYVKAIGGGDIDEDEDIDKEIALFKIELQTKVNPKKKVSKKEIEDTIKESIIPFIEKFQKKMSVIADFFESAKLTLDIEPSKSKLDFLRSNGMSEYYYSLYDHIDWALRTSKKIEAIFLKLELNDFKNPDNIFNVSGDLEITFQDEEYSIIDINKIEVYKFYGERLSVKDENHIFKEFINSIRYLVNQNFEE